MPKPPFDGRVASVQPRIRLLRSFDERSHNYLGYALRLDGTVGGEKRTFTVGIGKAAHEKHQLHAGDVVAGEAEPVADPAIEAVQFYKVSGLKIIARGQASPAHPPPWHGVPPALAIYRERGHRRLDANTYEASCSSCIWGALMPVEMTIDQWDPRKKKYRQETWCYGPKSCSLYNAGPTREVPGRKGMVHEEEDWVDDDPTQCRALVGGAAEQVPRPGPAPGRGGRPLPAEILVR